MDLSDWTGVIGVAIGLISFAYAIWERRARARLEYFIRAQNWALFEKASNANGHIQVALSKYKSLEKNNLDPEVLEFLSKADAFGQDVFKDTIRQIQFSESQFDEKAVRRWIQEGRVAEKYEPLFMKLTPANNSIQPTAKAPAD